MSDARSPRHAVIIPHFNDTARLQRCLQALEPQLDPDTEVVVADNSSTEPLDDIGQAFPWARIVVEGAKGAAPARNRGVAETTAPWLFFLDCDCRPEPGWLAQARRQATGDPGQITGGRIEVFDETPRPRSGAEAFETVFAFDQAGYIRDKGFSVTANLLTTRAVFDEVGGFHAGKSEDLDWCHRATARGYRLVYDRSLAVSHPTRSDWPALKKKWRRLTEESFGLRPGGLRSRGRWVLRGLMMGPSIIAHLPRVLRHEGLDGQEKARGAGTLLRLRLARMGWMLRQAVTGRA